MAYAGREEATRSENILHAGTPRDILHSCRNSQPATHFFSRRGRKWLFSVEILAIRRSILCLSLGCSKNIVDRNSLERCLAREASIPSVETLSVYCTRPRRVKTFLRFIAVQIKRPGSEIATNQKIPWNQNGLFTGGAIYRV